MNFASQWNSKQRMLVSLLVGFVLQLLIPGVLSKLGYPRAALLSIWPGLLPILWATGGWFAGIAPAGYVVMFSINTIVYGLLVFSVISARRWCFAYLSS
jgi:hypothetical protein